MISLDNNAAERAIRRPVVTRKNAYGSRNDDAARLAARIWTVTATAEMAGLNVLTYLTAYLDACGRNGGKPLTGPDLERFLPWNASTRRPAHLGTAAPPRLTPERRSSGMSNQTGHAGHRHARQQDFRILTSRSPSWRPLHGIPASISDMASTFSPSFRLGDPKGSAVRRTGGTSSIRGSIASWEATEYLVAVCAGPHPPPGR